MIRVDVGVARWSVVEPLLGQLAEDPEPARRVQAARRLSELGRLPEGAIPGLVAALDDVAAQEEEEWIDWDGTVAGGTTHYGAWFAGLALGRAGTAGAAAVTEAACLGAAGALRAVGRVLTEVGADALLGLGPEGRARCREALGLAGDKDAPVKEWGEYPFAVTRRGEERDKAGAYLDWAEREEAAEGGWPREVGRLRHPCGADQARAAARLGACPDARFAAASLVDGLVLGGGLAAEAQGPAGEALVRLGPVLEDRRVAALCEAVRGHEPFHGLPGVMAALGAYGRRGVALGVPAALRPWTAAKAPRQAGQEWAEKIRWAAVAALKAVEG